MGDKEQSERMRILRSIVAEFNTYRWAGEMLADAARLRAYPARHQHLQSRSQADVLPA
jgi:trehalose-6-phosphate synthase